MNNGVCIFCKGKIPKHVRSDAIYCSDTCKTTVQEQRKRARQGNPVKNPRGPYKVTRKIYTSRRDAVNIYAKAKYKPIEGGILSRGRFSVSREAVKAGFRSGFERTLDISLKLAGVEYEYEPIKLPYSINATYKPDFVLANGIILEAKGVLDRETRVKMIAVKQQHPDRDIRFIFMNAESPIKGGKMTCAKWAEKNGFLYADGKIPDEWLTQ